MDQNKIIKAIGLAVVYDSKRIKQLLSKYGVNAEYLSNESLANAVFSVKNNDQYNKELSDLILPYTSDKSNFSLDPVSGIIEGLGGITSGIGNIINGKDQAAAQVEAARAAAQAAQAKSAANIKIALYISGAVVFLGIVALVIYKNRKK